MVRERTQRHRERGDDEEAERSAPESSGQQRRTQLDDDVEATLNEIDDVLEDNAEEFVRGYVQKGGE